MGNFIQAVGDHFELDGQPVMLRGWALGSWMNLEHFMIGMPGTNSMILEAFAEVYGKERAERFMDTLLLDMVREEDIRYLKSLGINTVRIVFGYHYFWDDDNPGVMLQRGLEHLDRVVQLCAGHELYCILDLHSTPGSQNTDWHSDNNTGQALFWKYRCFQDQVVWFWEELSARYAENPWVAGYDVINEPGWDVTAEQINGFYDRIIKAIRKRDKNHILFLEGTDFGRDFSTLQEVSDPQVAYTVHFYPFVLENDILDPKLDDAKRMEIFTDIFERQLCETARLHRPVWCGESGYEILDGMEDFYGLLLQHNISLCEKRGVSWNLWTYKDARRMGIVIPKTDSKWIRLRRRIEADWNHDWEQKVSMEIIHSIGDRYYRHLDEKLAYELDFRIRSVMHRIAVEQILKPALREIPWEEIITYPESFLFEQCDRRERVIESLF